jgi:hypothetical protein
MTAGQRGNTDNVEALLNPRRMVLRNVRPTAASAASEDEAESAQQRWELEGGHV